MQPPTHRWTLSRGEAIAASGQSVAALYSAALPTERITNAVSSVRFGVGSHDSDARAGESRVVVTANVDRADMYEQVSCWVPPGAEQLDPSDRARLVLEALHVGMLRLAVARGWDQDSLVRCRRSVIQAGFEHVLHTPWLSSPDRRHRARLAHVLTPWHQDGLGRARLEIAPRRGASIAHGKWAPVSPELDSFRRCAKSLAWTEHGHVTATVDREWWHGVEQQTTLSATVRTPPLDQPTLPPDASWSFGRGGAGRRPVHTIPSPDPTRRAPIPAVVVAATELDAPWSRPRLDFIGGGPTNDVPPSYRDALGGWLGRVTSEAGQLWWREGGIRVAEIFWDADVAKPAIRVRRHQDTMVVTVARPPATMLDPSAEAAARHDAEGVVTALRRSTGLGPHPEVAG